MVVLSREDWAEIYYALETKLSALKLGKYGSEDHSGLDTEWIAHIEAIKERIGPDGLDAALRGVKRGK
jgi:hypothetical protein